MCRSSLRSWRSLLCMVECPWPFRVWLGWYFARFWNFVSEEEQMFCSLFQIHISCATKRNKFACRTYRWWNRWRRRESWRRWRRLSRRQRKTEFWWDFQICCNHCFCWFSQVIFCWFLFCVQSQCRRQQKTNRSQLRWVHKKKSVQAQTVIWLVRPTACSCDLCDFERVVCGNFCMKCCPHCRWRRLTLRWWSWWTQRCAPRSKAKLPCRPKSSSTPWRRRFRTPRRRDGKPTLTDLRECCPISSKLHHFCQEPTCGSKECVCCFSSGGWIFDNFPQTRDQWNVLIERGTHMPDDVLVLRDTSENGEFLLERWYSANRTDVDARVQLRLEAEAAEQRRVLEEKRWRFCFVCRKLVFKMCVWQTTNWCEWFVQEICVLRRAAQSAAEEEERRAREEERRRLVEEGLEPGTDAGEMRRQYFCRVRADFSITQKFVWKTWANWQRHRCVHRELWDVPNPFVMQIFWCCNVHQRTSTLTSKQWTQKEIKHHPYRSGFIQVRNDCALNWLASASCLDSSVVTRRRLCWVVNIVAPKTWANNSVELHIVNYVKSECLPQLWNSFSVDMRISSRYHKLCAAHLHIHFVEVVRDLHRHETESFDFVSFAHVHPCFLVQRLHRLHFRVDIFYDALYHFRKLVSTQNISVCLALVLKFQPMSEFDKNTKGSGSTFITLQLFFGSPGIWTTWADSQSHHNSVDSLLYIHCTCLVQKTTDSLRSRRKSRRASLRRTRRRERGKWTA